MTVGSFIKLNEFLRSAISCTIYSNEVTTEVVPTVGQQEKKSTELSLKSHTIDHFTAATYSPVYVAFKARIFAN